MFRPYRARTDALQWTSGALPRADLWMPLWGDREYATSKLRQRGCREALRQNANTLAGALG